MKQLRTPEVTSRLEAYLAVLPTPQTPGYATTTDFFTPEERLMLQWPPIQVRRSEEVRGLGS